MFDMKHEDLKVGMRVVCTTPSVCFKTGDIAEVLKIDNSDNTFKAKYKTCSVWQRAANWEPYKPEFKVGDRVRIRSWESMEREFGLDSDGDIETHPRFVRDMKERCGREATIYRIDDDGDFQLTDYSGGIQSGDWYFCIDMLEKIEEKKETKEMDKIAEVARILGVVKGEKFKVEGEACNPFMITDEGLIDCDRDVRKIVLTELLMGEREIIKLPFKPAKGEKYWCLIGTGDVHHTTNDCYAVDYYRISAGDCFRTEEEAKAAAPEIVKKVQEFFGA